MILCLFKILYIAESVENIRGTSKFYFWVSVKILLFRRKHIVSLYLQVQVVDTYHSSTMQAADEDTNGTRSVDGIVVAFRRSTNQVNPRRRGEENFTAAEHSDIGGNTA